MRRYKAILKEKENKYLIFYSIPYRKQKGSMKSRMSGFTGFTDIFLSFYNYAKQPKSKYFMKFLRRTNEFYLYKILNISDFDKETESFKMLIQGIYHVNNAYDKGKDEDYNYFISDKEDCELFNKKENIIFKRENFNSKFESVLISNYNFINKLPEN